MTQSDSNDTAMSKFRFPLFSVALRSSLIGCTVLVGACATPASLRGDFAEVTPTDVARAPESLMTPQRVRWGGTVLSLRNSENESCFEILARPLSYSARPERGDAEQGRFLACFPGFKDPEVFQPGRDVTVVGNVVKVEPVKVDKFEYNYPKVSGTDIYLWQERSNQPVYLADPFPFRYYGFGYYYYPTHYRAPRRSSTTAGPSVAAPQSDTTVIDTSPAPMSMPRMPVNSGGLLGGR